MAYAEKTTVSVEKSRAEIERTLEKYGANQFAYGRDDDRGLASIQFAASDRHIRFIIHLPSKQDQTFWRHKRGRRTPEAAHSQWEQACRQKWRALALCIKAKLEAVDANISEFEEEFMAHIVLPDGATVGEFLKPQIKQAYQTGGMPPGISGLLPSPNDG